MLGFLDCRFPDWRVLPQRNHGQEIIPYRVGPVLTTKASFPTNGSLVLGCVEGTFMDVISGGAGHADGGRI